MCPVRLIALRNPAPEYVRGSRESAAIAPAAAADKRPNTGARAADHRKLPASGHARRIALPGRHGREFCIVRTQACRAQAGRHIADSSGLHQKQRNSPDLKSPLPIISYRAEKLLELGGNCVLAGPGVPADVQYVRLAAHLAVFNIALPRPAGGIDLGFVPLAAASALKPRQHQNYGKTNSGHSR